MEKMPGNMRNEFEHLKTLVDLRPAHDRLQAAIAAAVQAQKTEEGRRVVVTPLSTFALSKGGKILIKAASGRLETCAKADVRAGEISKSLKIINELQQTNVPRDCIADVKTATDCLSRLADSMAELASAGPLTQTPAEEGINVEEATR